MTKRRKNKSAAARGWETRRKKARERSRAAKKGWQARRRKEHKRSKKPKPAPKTKPSKITAREEFILSVWKNLDDEGRRTALPKLGAAARERLPKIDRVVAAPKKKKKPKKTKTELRQDLERDLDNKNVSKTIDKEVHDLTRKEIVVTNKNESHEAAKKLVGRRKKKKKIWYYATIAIATEHPPPSGYNVRKLHKKSDLHVFYVQAQRASSLSKLQENIEAAIENVRAQLPGHAPFAVVGVHIEERPAR